MSEIDVTTLDAQQFGSLVRALRENYAERVMGRPRGRPDAPAPRLRLSAQALIACMADMGYTISSGAFSEIESGANLPRDPARFLDAVSVCLKLSPADHQALAEQLAYDVLKGKLGSDLAKRVVRRWREETPRAGGAEGDG